MRKKIYYAKINYKWRIVRYVKGVKKPSKEWRESSTQTCITDLDPEKLNKNKVFIKGLETKHKSTQELEIKLLSVVDYKYLCMSNDVY
jgi:hypothetical protein|tara:strand:- start:2160 stop:2423 length:264 start_codon:yes stop_codon:yes gene_type:complete